MNTAAVNGGPAPVIPPPARVAGRRMSRVSAGAAGPLVSGMAMVLVATSLFFTISRFHMALSVLAKLQFLLLISATATFAMFAEMPRWRPADLGKHWIPKAVAFLIAIAILGTPMSIYPGRSARYLWESYGVTVTLAILAWGVARTPQGVKLIARIVSSSVLVTCVLAWLMNRRDRDGRLGGAYTYDSNDLALMAGVAVPLMLWWALDRSQKHRWVPFIGIPICVKIVMMTGSRGGFLGLAMVAIGLVIAGLSAGRGKLRSIGLTLGVGAILSFPILPASVQDRLLSIGDENDYNLTSVTGRKAVWLRGVGYMMDNPFLGVGIDNFRTAEGRLSDVGQERGAMGKGFKWSVSHNSFLQVGAELGLVAGIVFTTTMVCIPVALFRRYKRLRIAARGAEVDHFPVLLAVAVMSYNVTGFFLSQAYGDTVYLLLAMSAAVLMQKEPVVTAQPVGQPPLNRRYRRGARAR